MRNAAEKVYTDYRQPFLDTIKGALTKDLLLREEDVQVLHGFDSAAHAKAYLSSAMFQNDVFVGYPPGAASRRSRSTSWPEPSRGRGENHTCDIKRGRLHKAYALATVLFYGRDTVVLL